MNHISRRLKELFVKGIKIYYFDSFYLVKNNEIKELFAKVNHPNLSSDVLDNNSGMNANEN